MFSKVESAIVSLLREKGINASVWSGEKEELFRLPRALPAVRLVLEKATFQPASSHAYKVTMHYALLLFFRSLTGTSQGAYSLLEDILQTLVHKTHFNLVPEEINLLYSDAGEYCYNLSVTCQYLFVLPAEPEPLVKRITTFEGEELVSDVQSNK